MHKLTYVANYNYVHWLNFTHPKDDVAPRFKQYIKEKGFQLKDLSDIGMGLVLTVAANSNSL